ncbi:MAG: hypothetical protein KJZ78_21115, partial [Bryobacteraceae bacterium]|nr:hypothetical protein [Bryobacteraceae bacterium]
MTKRVFVVCAALAVLAAGQLFAAAPAKPKSVIHVVTVQWKPDASKEQIQQAIAGVENMNFPGLKNVWTRPI